MEPNLTSNVCMKGARVHEGRGCMKEHVYMRARVHEAMGNGAASLSADRSGTAIIHRHAGRAKKQPNSPSLSLRSTGLAAGRPHPQPLIAAPESAAG